MKYLLDTNAVSDMMRDVIPEDAKPFMQSVVKERPVISVISRIELEGNRNHTTEDAELIKEFCALAEVLELELPIVERSIEIRKSKSIKTPDAIIAATALTHNLKLITRNISDFSGIKGLSVINSWEPRKAQ